MARFTNIIKITVVILLAGTVINSRGAVAITPELEQSREEDRIRQTQLNAELSLHEKIQVGKQRYEERQAFRSTLIEGMRAQVEERRDDISGKGRANPGGDQGEPFDSTDVIFTVVLLLAGFHAFRYFQKRQSEDLILTKSLIDKAPRPAIETAPKEAIKEEVDWRHIIRAVQLPANIAVEASHDTTFICKSDSSERLQPLKKILGELQSVKVCVDVSAAAKEAIQEDLIGTHLQSMLEKMGMRMEEESTICLALVVSGSWDEKHAVFAHKEKMVLLENDALFKKSIVGKWPDPVVLWGAGYTGVAEKREAETDILAVIKVFTDMLANDVLAVQGQEQLV
jgi:hypothetical protein